MHGPCETLYTYETEQRLRFALFFFSPLFFLQLLPTHGVMIARRAESVSPFFFFTRITRYICIILNTPVYIERVRCIISDYGNVRQLQSSSTPVECQCARVRYNRVLKNVVVKDDNSRNGCSTPVEFRRAA